MFLAQGFSTPLLVDDRATLRHRQIQCLLTGYSTPCSTLLRELQRTTRLSATTSPSSACTNPPEPPNSKFDGLRGLSTWRSPWLWPNPTSTAKQPTERLSSVDSRRASPLEGESGLTPAGKTPPTHFPKQASEEGACRLFAQSGLR